MSNRVSEYSRRFDNPGRDAFSRLRVSNPTGLFSSQGQYDYDPLQYEVGATGTGVTPTHSANDRMTTLSATAGSGTSWIQSYQYIPYQPGKSQLIFITGTFGTGVAGVKKDLGYFDASNGVFLRQNGTSGLQAVLRSSVSGSVVDTVVDQADFNLDTLDGTNRAFGNPSAWDFDETKNLIFLVDLQFLAMGRLRLGLDLDGSIIYFHEFRNANLITGPYMQTASLPIQALLTAASSAAPASMKFKCASVISEGGFSNDLGYRFATGDGTATAGNNARGHILSLRPNTTFNGISYRGLFVLDTVDIMVTGNQPVYWELVVGCQFSVDPTWADINIYHSGFEYGTGGTYSGLTGGLVLSSGYIASGASFKGQVERVISTRIPITLNRAGQVTAINTLSLLVTGIGGTSTCRASMDFFEIR